LSKITVEKRKIVEKFEKNPYLKSIMVKVLKKLLSMARTS